ncbi:Exostosin-like [Parasponia andersonii]|uniref:Exostosin-like n=1 Tax=Parasponia andersonii TaxID=3476 RepID=A0A2P5D3E2_PARAD|nr:Exostosin-like [Parasponia andersonii]
MVQKFLCQVQKWRLIWTIGLMFSLILAFQNFRLPYGDFLSFLQNVDSPSKSKFIGSMKPENLGNVDSGLTQEEARELQKSLAYIKNDNSNNNSSRGRVGTPVVGFPPPSHVSSLDNSSLYTTAIVLYSNVSTSAISGNINNSLVEKSKAVTFEPPRGDFNQNINNSPVTKVSKINIHTPAISGNSNTYLAKKNRTVIYRRKKKSKPVHSDLSQMDRNSQMNKVSNRNRRSKMPVLDSYSLSQMNNLLLQSHASYYSVIPQWPSVVDHELQDVTSQIENAPIVQNDPNLYAPLYRNFSIFKRSYELMEQTLKVYIYKEGEKPILHTPILDGIYASEGWFMKLLEANEQFVTKDPRKAHMFYLPFSSQMLRETLYVPNSHKRKNIVQYLKHYLDMIAAKYPFWNRTGGADHFLVACHDWAPKETRRDMAKCIRALCNADVQGGFVFGKDVSLPETYIYLPNDTLRDLGGKPASKRSTLAFFAGRVHGYLRPILLKHWENKDPDMKLFGKMHKTDGNNSYTNYMKSSKYCISAKGYEGNTPRVVEAIFYECVPVIISDNYVPPFFDVLNWESFAVFVLEKDIPNLKNILISITEKRYRQMQMTVKRVQQHFLWHEKPVKYDIFHMILHSIWYNRLHQIRPM